MSQILLPGEMSPAHSLEIASEASAFSLKMLVRRTANRLLNRVRLRFRMLAEEEMTAARSTSPVAVAGQEFALSAHRWR